MALKVYNPSQWTPELTGYYSLEVAGDPFEVENAEQPWSLSSTDDESIRFELRAGDYYSWDISAAGHGAQRTEIADRTSTPDGTPIEVSYGLSIEPGAKNTATWLVLGQLHPGDSFTAPLVIGPPFEVAMIGERMEINIVSADANGTPAVHTLYTDLSDIVRGHNYDFDIKAIFDPAGNGRLVVVRDGVTLVDYTGPLGYANQTGVVWHEGIYRSPNATETIAATFKDLTIASGSAVTIPDASEFIAAPVLSVAAILAGSGGTYAASLTGTAKANTTVTISEGTAILGTAQADATGHFALTLTLPSAGEHLLSAVAVDATGRSGIPSVGMAVEIGTAADIVARMGAIAAEPALGAIVLTDTSVLDLTSTGQMYNFIKVDAADMAKIEGPYSFRVTVAVTGHSYDTQVELYTAAGTLTERLRYAKGALMFDDAIAADGSQVVKTASPQGGWTVSIVAADGFMTTYTHYAASGATISAQAFARDGSNTITYYDATGRETGFRTTNADKTSVSVTLGIVGQSYAIQVSNFSATGVSTSQQRYSAQGTLVWSQASNADGSMTVANYDPSSGRETSYVTTNADKSSVQGRFGIVGQSYSAETITLSKAGVVTGTTTFDALGPIPPPSPLIMSILGTAAVTSTQTRPDGSEVVSTYQPGSSTLLASVQTFSASGTLVETDGYDAAGQLSTVDTYDKSGHHSGETQYFSDGSRASTTYDPTTGAALQVVTLQTDGSRTIENDAVVGKSYATQSISFDAAGKVVALSRYYGDAAHTLALSQVTNADGSDAVHSYDTLGRETSRTMTAADGSSEVVNSSYSGASTTAATVQDYHYAAGNKLLSSDTTNANGTHTQVAALAGVSLTSTAGVADSLASAGAGADTFVFKPAFGQDMVTNFHAGAGASHDTVDLSALQLAQSPGQSSLDVLAQSLHQVGRDAVLTISPTDTVTLKNTAVASLTKEDFRV